MMGPALALLLLAGGAQSAPPHALLPSDDGPPSTLHANHHAWPRHPRPTAKLPSALLPNDHERVHTEFYCKKTRYDADGKRRGAFGGVWHRGMADSKKGIRFLHKRTGWTDWYVPKKARAEQGVVFMVIPDGTGDYWKIEMDRRKYNKPEAVAKAQSVLKYLQASIERKEKDDRLLSLVQNYPRGKRMRDDEIAKLSRMMSKADPT